MSRLIYPSWLFIIVKLVIIKLVVIKFIIIVELIIIIAGYFIKYLIYFFKEFYTKDFFSIRLFFHFIIKVSKSRIVVFYVGVYCTPLRDVLY